jgi:transposase, IS5 family
MKPNAAPAYFQADFTRPDLGAFIDLKHPLVILGRQMNWASFEQVLGQTYCPDIGAPGLPTRLMVALHYLKYQHDLSDDATLELWVQNPYWQHFSGSHFFQHERPCDASSMTRWRQRLGTAGGELMLKETIATALKTGAATPAQMTRVNVDTTVQTKNVRFPTDTRLYDRARQRLVKTARAAGLSIKQSYERTGPRLLKQLSRLSRSHKTKQARACARKLHTNLGRVIREIERQKFDPESKLGKLLAVAQRIHTQQKHDKNKIYSVHEPEVQCIAKGKAGKKYEIGNKAGVVTTSQGCWLIGAMDFRDNPYDGHTLNDQMAQVERIVSNLVKEAHTDMGYRKHNYEGPVQVHVDKRHRGTIAKALWKRMKRRAAIEPTIGHLKSEHHLERNRLKGALGDSLNVLLGACAMNLRKLLRFLLAFFIRTWLEQFARHLAPNSALRAV